jgi:hypothetical protein
MSDLNPTAFIYSCDYSSKAVQLLQSSPRFKAHKMTAFVADITRNGITAVVPAQSVDVATAIFVLSANSADSLAQVPGSERQACCKDEAYICCTRRVNDRQESHVSPCTCTWRQAAELCATVLRYTFALQLLFSPTSVVHTVTWHLASRGVMHMQSAGRRRTEAGTEAWGRLAPGA